MMIEEPKARSPVPFTRLLPMAVVLLSMVPILSVHAMQLWSRPHYQFFPAVLVACGLLAAARWPSAGWQCDSWVRASIARFLYLLGLAAFIIATGKLSPLLAWGALLVIVAGLLVHGRLPLWGPWLLLILLFRLPQGWDLRLIQGLQSATTGMSSLALDALHIEHNVRGNVIQLPKQKLFVEEACSGVVSLMTLVATAVVFAVWMRRSFVHGLLLAASGIVWAGAMNIFRICVIVAALAWYDVDLLGEAPHAVLGTISFVLAVGLLLSTDRLLSFLLAPIPDDPMSPVHDEAEGNPLVAVWNRVNPPPPPEETLANDHRGPDADNNAGWRVFDWSLALVAVALAAAQFYAGIGPFRMTSRVPHVVTALDEKFLPAEFDGWIGREFAIEDRGTGSDFGEHSRMWSYVAENYRLTLSIDYPFQEWHELSACYRSQGWELKPHAGPSDYREYEMTLSTSERAVLIFDLCETDGNPYEAPAGGVLHPTWRRVMEGGSRWTMPTYLQMQALLVARDGEITEEVHAEARLAFEEFRRRIIATLRQEGDADAQR